MRNVLDTMISKTRNGGNGIYSFPVKEAYKEWYEGDSEPKYPATLVNKVDRVLKAMGVEGHRVHYATLIDGDKKEQRVYVNLSKATLPEEEDEE